MTHSLRERRNRAFLTVEAAVCLQRVFDKHTYPTGFLFYCQRMEGSPGSKSLPRHIPSLPMSPPDEPGKSRAHVLPTRAWLLGLYRLFVQNQAKWGDMGDHLEEPLPQWFSFTHSKIGVQVMRHFIAC